MMENTAITFTSQTTRKISDLAKLKLKKKEERYLTKQFNQTLKVLDRLTELPTARVAETSQVTGLKNVFRKDEIDKSRILSQKEALSNAKNSHNGFFVVAAIFDEK